MLYDRSYFSRQPQAPHCALSVRCFARPRRPTPQFLTPIQAGVTPLAAAILEPHMYMSPAWSSHFIVIA